MIHVEAGQLREAGRGLPEGFASSGVLRRMGTKTITGGISGSRVEIDLDKTDAFGNHPIISKSWTDKPIQPEPVKKRSSWIDLFKRQ